MSTIRTTDDRAAIMTIVEGREKVGRGNIGIAVVDLKRATCCLYQVRRTDAARPARMFFLAKKGRWDDVWMRTQCSLQTRRRTFARCSSS